MENTLEGSALTFGDNINTDIISPPQFMELPIAEAAKHAMSAVDPDFAAKAGPTTIIVAGANFGSGSSRETSPLTLKFLGIRAIVAQSFARIFYRNGINVGLVLVECPDAGRIAAGDRIVVDLAKGSITNMDKNETYACDKIPEHIMRLIGEGGLVASLKKRFAN